MSTKIEWTDVTWNPVVGCTKVSPGCTHCYAETVASSGRLQRLPQYQDVVEGGHWTGKINLVPSKLGDPLKWKQPKRIFVNSMSDLFHEDVPFEYIAAVFGVMAATRQHTYQVLTKRPERMLEWFEWIGQHNDRSLKLWQALSDASDSVADFMLPPIPTLLNWPPSNIQVGVSVEDDKRKPRIDILRQIPAATRMLSLEPLLSDLGELDLTSIHWVIVGGESGKNARPTNPNWVRSIRDQCVSVGVPFFFKQWGEYCPSEGGLVVMRDEGFEPATVWRAGKKRAGRLLDGREWNEYPGGKQ
jgi:protein gp37